MTTRRQFLSSLFATLITAPLVRLGWKKAPRPARLDKESGITIRRVTHYDRYLSQHVSRLDVFYGWGSDFAVPGQKIGDTITVRTPDRYRCVIEG